MKVWVRSLAWVLLGILLTAAANAQTGSIQGKVKAQGGKALAGVTVRATNLDKRQEVRETKTDEKGEFVVSGLSAGDYTLAFERSGFRTASTYRQPLKAGETIKLHSTIELYREGKAYALVRGAVLTADGYSLPSARVTIERVGSKGFKKEEKFAAEGGEFAFRVPVEKAIYKVTAEARGFEPLSKEVAVEGEEIRQVSLPLEKKN